MASSFAILFADNLTTTANAQEEQQLSNQLHLLGMEHFLKAQWISLE